MKINLGYIETEDDILPKMEKPIIVDIRPLGKIGKINIPYPRIMSHLNEFKKGKTYLIICDFGVRSENIAYILRRKGIKAIGISFKNFQRLTK